MIYIDFDGTLVDVWPRFYSVFCDINEKYNIQFDEYKKIKLKYGKDELVAKEFGFALCDNYFYEKKNRLENLEYLAKDIPFLPIEYINSKFSENTMILTKRRNPENFKKQIKDIGLKLPYRVIAENISKLDWIQKYEEHTSGIIIGDSVVDLEVGKTNYIFPYMVKSGLGTYYEFEKMGVKYKLFDNLLEVIHELEEKKLIVN